MNIVFDLGNVLLHWDPRHLYRKIFDDEAEMEWFLREVCHSDWNLEQDRGRSFDDAVVEATTRHPDYAEEIAAYHHRWHETLPHAIDGTVRILEELQERGAPLYAITNWSGEKFRETRPRFPFLEHFRDIVVSGDERLIKPDAAIYRVLLSRNGLDAEACLFIDDNAGNVEGAKVVGMQGHHFTTAQNLRADLQRRGLLE